MLVGDYEAGDQISDEAEGEDAIAEHLAHAVEDHNPREDEEELHVICQVPSPCERVIGEFRVVIVNIKDICPSIGSNQIDVALKGSTDWS